MKIAMYNLTTTVKEGGIETFFWEVSKELAQRGYEIHMYGGKGSIQKPLPSSVSVKTFPYLSRELIIGVGNQYRKFIERLSIIPFCIKELVAQNYDYIITGKPYDLPICLFLKKIKCSKVIYCAGGDEKIPCYSRLVSKVDVFTACSRYLAQKLHLMTRTKPCVIYNGVDPNLFCPRNSKEDVTSVFNIITVARLRRGKGIQHVIEALRLIKSKCKEIRIRYIIVGSGKYQGELEKQVKDTDLAKEIMFMGKVPYSKIPMLYAKSHVAIYPSTGSETFGISAAEAMACGLPVIVSNRGGLPEVAKKGGIIIEPKPDTIAGAIMRLYMNPKERLALGESARKRILAHFTWRNTGEQLDKIIRSL